MNIAVCPDCLAVDSPSHVGEKCSCGATLEAKEVDFFNAERILFASIKRRISIMLQRNFALYDEETVIENVMRAIGDRLSYEESLYKYQVYFHNLNTRYLKSLDNNSNKHVPHP